MKISKGEVTARVAEDYDIHREYLSEFARRGKLERVVQDVYITSENRLPWGTASGHTI